MGRPPARPKKYFKILKMSMNVEKKKVLIDCFFYMFYIDRDELQRFTPVYIAPETNSQNHDYKIEVQNVSLYDTYDMGPTEPIKPIIVSQKVANLRMARSKSCINLLSEQTE